MRIKAGWQAEKAALTYVIVAGALLWLSDQLPGLKRLPPNPQAQLLLLRDWIYVVLTGAGGYLWLRRWFRRRTREAEARELDITGRKQAEIALRESEEKFSRLFQSSPIAMALSTLEEGRYLDVNDEFLRLLQRTREEVIGHTALELQVWLDPGRRAELLREILTRGMVRNVELEIHTPTGLVRHILWSAEKMAGGGKTWLLGSLLDITERKQTEAQMSLQLNALTAAANAIVITNRDGKIEWVNPAFTQLTGFSAAEAVGTNPRTWKSGRHPPAFYATLWATISTGNVWHGEIVNRRKQGGLYTEDMTITPVRGADGEITHFVAIKQDVTEQRVLEAQCLQAQKMEAIGTLAGGIAHDFNNILAIMLGSCHLLQHDTAGNAPAQANLRDLLQAANRAKDLVQQILTFSRQSELKRQVIHLNTVVNEAAKFLRASLPSQIQIETRLAAEAPAVLADATQIYQVAMNLGTNALHAMEGQPGRLTLTLDSFSPDKTLIQGNPSFRPIPYARLTVTDTGHGMDAETLKRIYEPFFTTKPVGKGTGLGLAVVHGIVQSHGGIITVASEPGRGTTFTLYFPAQKAPEAAAPAAPGRLPLGQGQKLLMVDDEPALMDIFQQVMRRLNYDIRTCNSAREAIALFQQQPGHFDLVITDMTMPEMNGLEVARQIHALRPTVPIILATGHTANLSEEDLRGTGIRELLIKPISVPSLAELVHRLLAKPA